MHANAPHNAANDAVSDLAAQTPFTPRPGIDDWEGYVAGGGEIQDSIVDECDACGTTAEVHVIGPYGGLLAFCADPDACAERQRSPGEPGERQRGTRPSCAAVCPAAEGRGDVAQG